MFREQRAQRGIMTRSAQTFHSNFLFPLLTQIDILFLEGSVSSVGDMDPAKAHYSQTEGIAIRNINVKYVPKV